jgi:hypothetical protein
MLDYPMVVVSNRLYQQYGAVDKARNDSIEAGILDIWRYDWPGSSLKSKSIMYIPISSNTWASLAPQILLREVLIVAVSTREPW